MAEFDGLSDFVKVASHRLADAEELMQRLSLRPNSSDQDTRHMRGAAYLAGYAAECLVKAYLISQERCLNLRDAQTNINARRERQGLDKVRDFFGVAGHGIEYLASLTDLGTLSGYERQLWGRVGRWQSTWRYDPGPLSREKAELFLEDVRKLVNWLQPKI